MASTTPADALAPLRDARVALVNVTPRRREALATAIRTLGGALATNENDATVVVVGDVTSALRARARQSENASWVRADWVSACAKSGRAEPLVGFSCGNADHADADADADADAWTVVEAKPKKPKKQTSVRAFAMPLGMIEPPRTPVVLVLCGPSGAGKSTFSEALPSERWVVSNQDTVSNGKRGTRQQCVRVAKLALSEGKHVVIDRCGLSVQQREDFIALAREATPPCALHAVWFNQPLSLYQKRAQMRRNHPGGVEGDGAVRVVQMQMRRKDNAPPTREEGFHVVRRCRYQDDVDAALAAFTAMPAATLAVEFAKKPRASGGAKKPIETTDDDVMIID